MASESKSLTVFITTSGIGSRLDSLTQYTNKALVPIGDKYAICHIIEQFDPLTTEYVVTLGYYGNHVCDFLELAYPDRTFHFVWVDPYVGSGSSQAFSMLAAAPLLQKPFLYHCCDTLYKTTKPQPTNGKNTLYVAKHADYISYSGITVAADGLTIQSFNRKKEVIHDYVYTGVAYIHDWSTFWSILGDALRRDPTDTSLGDTTAYTAMLPALTYAVVEDFFDTGNLDSYQHACRAFPSTHAVLAKPNESLCFMGDTVIKFVANAATNLKRVERAQQLAPIVPQLIAYKENYIKMAYVQGTLMADCREYGLVRRLLDWAEGHVWTEGTYRPENIRTCELFYKEKTRQRIADYFRTHDKSQEAVVVNGIDVGHIDTLLDSLPWTELYTNRLVRYHGDFILDNIFHTKSEDPADAFCLIDWREEFADQVAYGDMYYDLAKLRHNIILNHRNVSAGLYTIQKEESGVFVDLKTNFHLVRQLEELDAWVLGRGWKPHKVRRIMALIWLNMAPLYPAPFSDFLFYFGKLNLWLETRPTNF